MNRSQAGPSDSPILVDAHVHFHPCFEPASFLDSAEANFSAAAAGLGLSGPVPGLLLFTESHGDEFFTYFAEQPEGRGPGGWSFRPTQEPVSLQAVRSGTTRLIVVAGRQVATADGLEVLALLCNARFADNRPIDETLESVRDSGALAAIPWGFGKWRGGRGSLLARVMAEASPASFFLGDNGGRPRLGRRPAPFRLAGRLGIRILPGSDPLPFPDHARRVGSYGCLLRGPLDAERPAAALKELLSVRATEPAPYGRSQSALPFLRNQVAMQRRKRSVNAT